MEALSDKSNSGGSPPHTEWGTSKLIEDYISTNCVVRLPGTRPGSNSSLDVRNILRRALKSAHEEGMFCKNKLLLHFVEMQVIVGF